MIQFESLSLSLSPTFYKRGSVIQSNCNRTEYLCGQCRSYSYLDREYEILPLHQILQFSLSVTDVYIFSPIVSVAIEEGEYLVSIAALSCTTSCLSRSSA